MTRFFKNTTTLFLLSFLISGNLIAGDSLERKPLLSFRAGGVLGSEIEYRGVASDYDPFCLNPDTPGEPRIFACDPSFSLGGALDFPVARFLSLGVAIDLNHMSFGPSDKTWAVIWSAHGLFGPPRNLEKVAIRPGIGVGYSAFQDSPAGRDSDHLVLKGLVQIGWESREKIGWLVEGAVFAFGYRDMDPDPPTVNVRPKPQIVFRAGVVF